MNCGPPNSSAGRLHFNRPLGRWPKLSHETATKKNPEHTRSASCFWWFAMMKLQDFGPRYTQWTWLLTSIMKWLFTTVNASRKGKQMLVPPLFTNQLKETSQVFTGIVALISIYYWQGLVGCKHGSQRDEQLPLVRCVQIKRYVEKEMCFQYVNSQSAAAPFWPMQITLQENCRFLRRDKQVTGGVPVKEAAVHCCCLLKVHFGVPQPKLPHF